MEERTSGFKWVFHRMGGLDQVMFQRGEDVCRLGELDPKLWVALSCPAKGLEFDQRTLTLVDVDKDGRIRIPEIIRAAEWVCARLKDPGIILKPGDALPLEAIDASHEIGRRLVATGKAILAQRGTPDAAGITQVDVEQAVLHASEQMFNGDGILPPLAGLDEDMRAFIGDALAVAGGVDDIGGETGINAAIAEAFMQSLRQWRDWRAGMAKAESPLGGNTAACWRLLSELKDKIDDYFMRCELAAYSPAAQAQLNLEDKPLVDESGLVAAKALAELPLSKAGPDRPLDLTSGLNPVWREKIEKFADLAQPLLATPGQLSRSDWLNIQKILEPFSQAVAKKPSAVPAEGVTVSPTKQVDDLGEDRIAEILRSGIYDRFLKLAADDADGPAASTDIADMERLVRYYLHLHRLLINFVNFEEFYELDERAAFQSGSLFIDGRSCHLCMPADNVDEHAELAKSSQLYLLYCDCVRGKKPGSADPEKKMSIVAAVTAGESDLLKVNRNGVFVDNKGDDWDAKVVKVVSNPISIREAVWSPYKRFGILVTDQISKYASEKQAGLMQSASKKFDEVGASVASGAAPKFDIGRNVGMFAAVGLALGAIGTAVGSIFNALLAMSWWQLPLVVLGLFALISGPSVLLAWLKLRQRTLGPLLEASGWAINGRVALGYGAAKQLCSLAVMPPNAKRSDLDPIMRMKRLRRSVFWIAVAVGALGTLGVLVAKEYRAQKAAGNLPAVTASAPVPQPGSVGAEETKAEEAGRQEAVQTGSGAGSESTEPEAALEKTAETPAPVTEETAVPSENVSGVEPGA